MMDLEYKFLAERERQCMKHNLARHGQTCRGFAEDWVDGMTNSEFLEELGRHLAEMFSDFEQEIGRKGTLNARS